MIDLEFAILHLIQNMKSPFFDGFFRIVTHLGDGGIIWICISLALIIYGKLRKNRNALLCGISMLAAIVIGFVSGNLVLKPLIARKRPFEALDISLLIKTPTDFSFPSGHTLSSFAASVSVFLRNKKGSIPMIILALLIAFSRLYLYVHFPSDILGGIILGTASAYAAKYVVNRITEAKL